jgi:hypothetical protein
MDIHKELVEVDKSDIGLDRSHITYQGQIEIPGNSTENSNDEISRLRGPEDQTSSTKSSTSKVVDKVRQKKHHAGIKLRKTLHIAKPEDEIQEPDPNSVVLADTTEVKQSNARLDHKSTAPEKHTLKDFLHKPVDTVKSKGSNQGKRPLFTTPMQQTWALRILSSGWTEQQFFIRRITGALLTGKL